MVINSVRLVKYHNTSLEPQEGFAVIMDFDEYNDRKTSQQAGKSYCFFPVSKETGRQIVQDYAGTDQLPSADQVLAWSAYDGESRLLGKYEVILLGHLNPFTGKVYFHE